MNRKAILNVMSNICISVALAIGGYWYGATRTATDTFQDAHGVLSDYLNAETERLERATTDPRNAAPYPDLANIADVSAKVDTSILKRTITPTMLWWFGFWPLMAIGTGIQGYITRVLDRTPVHPKESVSLN